ncbi:GTP cyclohydrolase II [Robbsia sp. Bb-Pol-6]|uniref:GTP cyclohydrolase-2 n=1 Tax=Robbsia betulipollinis TaxID=2981849 RepID=A0ABT3ZNH7_9BURK|nr:GTP cyclohydrolase II [Robbsia betulipollinis]MCY0388101.1 GTP cyclohydrolase II [Robbsia betulipollinis]
MNLDHELRTTPDANGDGAPASGGAAPAPLAVEPATTAAPVIERVATARMPTAHGVFTAHVYRDPRHGTEHVALVAGDVRDGDAILTRLHSECLTGDAFASLRCDCGAQLASALDRLNAEGRGVVVYLRGQEGRGIGLVNKIRAYELQDQGRDTVDANVDLGLPVDARDYDAGIAILRDLGVRSVRLMSNNPTKLAAIRAAGIPVVERIALRIAPNPENQSYLETKRARMGHLLNALGGPLL